MYRYSSEAGPDKEIIDALAERIKLGIAQRGVHLLFEDELSIIWRHSDATSDQEKIFLIRNFANVYGFEALVSNPANMAIFKISNQAPRSTE
jgi:hypothetical protein